MAVVEQAEAKAATTTTATCELANLHRPLNRHLQGGAGVSILPCVKYPHVHQANTDLGHFISGAETPGRLSQIAVTVYLSRLSQKHPYFSVFKLAGMLQTKRPPFAFAIWIILNAPGISPRSRSRSCTWGSLLALVLVLAPESQRHHRYSYRL